MAAAQQWLKHFPVAHLAQHQRNLQGLLDDVGMAVDQVVEHHTAGGRLWSGL